jgi:hypothetical protein
MSAVSNLRRALIPQGFSFQAGWKSSSLTPGSLSSPRLTSRLPTTPALVALAQGGLTLGPE